MPHEKRKDFASTEPCHVTLKVVPGLQSLRDGAVAREIEEAFRRGCVRKGMRVVHYSIQDDHAHLIVEADGAKALGNGMKSIASLFAFAVNRALGRTGKVLWDRYHHRVLKSPRQVRNAIAYVLLNARRHAAKRIAKLKKAGVKNVAPLGRARRVDAYSYGAVVRGLALGRTHAARREAAGGRASHLVPATRVAIARADRSERDPRIDIAA
jgi:hypothetical protein